MRYKLNWLSHKAAYFLILYDNQSVSFLSHPGKTKEIRQPSSTALYSTAHGTKKVAAPFSSESTHPRDIYERGNWGRSCLVSRRAPFMFSSLEFSNETLMSHKVICPTPHLTDCCLRTRRRALPIFLYWHHVRANIFCLFSSFNSSILLILRHVHA